MGKESRRRDGPSFGDLVDALGPAIIAAAFVILLILMAWGCHSGLAESACDVKRLLPLSIMVVPVLAFVAAIWAVDFHNRTSAAEVTKVAYAKFGPGPRIICVAQDGNRATWYCRSPRWGDDPNCRPANVSVTGSISIANQTVACE